MIPELCPRCLGPTGRGFCDGCRGDFLRVARPCGACALPWPVAHCPRRDSSWRVARVVAPYLYAAPLSTLLQSLKFTGVRALGRAFGLLLAPEVEAAASRVDALLAVPLHPGRLRERGYNQAVEIARILARELRTPLLTAAARRRLPTRPQSTLRSGERQANLAAAFALSRDFAGASLAIVDDVVTTGATVNALAAAVHAAGARRVEAWAVARTPERAAAAGARPQPRYR